MQISRRLPRNTIATGAVTAAMLAIGVAPAAAAPSGHHPGHRGPGHRHAADVSRETAAVVPLSSTRSDTISPVAAAG